MSTLETPGTMHALSCNVAYICTLEAPLFLVAFLKDLTKRQTFGAFWSNLFKWNSWSWTDHLSSYIWPNLYCWCKRTTLTCPMSSHLNRGFITTVTLGFLQYWCMKDLTLDRGYSSSNFPQDERLFGFLLLFLYYGEIKFTFGIPFLPVWFYVGFRIPGFKSDSKNLLFHIRSNPFNMIPPFFLFCYLIQTIIQDGPSLLPCLNFQWSYIDVFWPSFLAFIAACR